MNNKIEKCGCGRKASIQCTYSKCFKCCDKSESEPEKGTVYHIPGHICKYHKIYKRAKSKYNPKHKPIILNRTTPSIDKIRKPHRKGKGNNVLVKFNKYNGVSKEKQYEIIKTLEKIINLSLGEHFENYSAKINIKINL